MSILTGGQTLPCGFSLDRNDFQPFDALASAFNPAEAPLRFHKKETRLVAFQLFFASFRRKISKNSKRFNHINTRQQRIKNGANFAGRYIEMLMRRVQTFFLFQIFSLFDCS